MVFSVPRVPCVCSFVTVPFLVSCVSYGVISCSYLGPFIFVGFTFSSRLLFCIILLCFVCGSGSFSSGSPYLFVVSGTAFRSLHMLGFGFGSPLFKVLIICGPGPFWLREPVLREECY